MGSAITLQWQEATLAAMYDAVRLAYPNEACGFLLGRGDVVHHVWPVANVAEDPRRSYRIEPSDLVAAHQRATADELSLLGVFHSHPDGEAGLSARDEAEAQAGWVYAVVATRGREPSELVVRRL